MAGMGFGGRPETVERPKGPILTSYTPLGRRGVAARSDWCLAAGGPGGMLLFHKHM